MQRPSYSQRTFLVLLYVESSQQHDCFLPEQTTVDRIWRVNAPVGVNLHHTATASKSIVQTAEVDCPDTVLSQRGSAHDAWLDSDIEVAFFDHVLRVLGHDLSQSDELCVASALGGLHQRIYRRNGDRLSIR